MANEVEVTVRLKDKATAQLKKFNDQLDKSAVALAAVSAAAVAAGLAIFKMVEASAKSSDQFNKFSQITGLTVEQLTRLSFAADQSKTTFASISKGITILSRNMFDMQQGLLENKAAFDALGVATEIDGKLRKTNDVLLDLADAFANMENGALKTGVAMKIFGKSGTELIPLLNTGRAGMEAFAQASDEMGITLDTLDTKLAEAFVDRLGQVDLQLRGLKASISTALIPDLLRLVESYSEVLTKTIEWVKENRALIRNMVAVGGRFALLSFALLGLTLALKGATLALSAFGVRAALVSKGPLLALVAAIGFLAIESAKTRAELEKPFDVRLGSLENLETVAAEQFRILKEIQDAGVAIRVFQSRLDTGDFGGSAFGKAVKEAEELRETILNLQGAIIIGSNSLNLLGKQATGLQDIEAILKAAAERAAELADEMEGISFAALQEGAMRAAEAVNNLTETELRAMEARLIDLQESAEAAAASMVLVGSIEGGGLSGEQVAILQAYVAALKEIPAQLQAVQDKLAETFIGPVLPEDFAGPDASAQDEDLEALAETARQQSEVFANFASGLVGQQVSLVGALRNNQQDAAEFMKGTMESIASSVESLISQLIVAIIKAKILKALTSSASILTGNPLGLISLGRGLLALHSGGEIARGQTGFSIAGAGGPDRVPALLAPGEVVLPTIGGIQPAALLSSLANLADSIKGERGLTPSVLERRGVADTHLTINAIDADRMREQVRHGTLFEERERAFDLERPF